MKFLEHALNTLDELYEKDYGYFYLENDYYSPGYFCALAAFIDLNNIQEENFDTDSELMSYLRTIGLHKAVWNRDDSINRVNCGLNYAPLTPLKSDDAIDTATTTINSCIRKLIGEKKSSGIQTLYTVVGELHDNVWSHGKSTGYSMAQRSAVPHTSRKDYFIEFSLVDRGMGFLEELQRAKIDINNSTDAIAWCIQKGNSSKLSDSSNEWLQRLPEDYVGVDPMMGFGGHVQENHHQGLGLAHLIDLIKNFQGELQLCTGDALLKISNDGKETYSNLNFPWKGVAISCKFKESKLLELVEKDTLEELRKKDIMNRLRGD